MREAVNLAQRLFIDSDGHVHPVVTMFDSNGEQCGPEDAVSVVAGTEGRWFVLDLSEFGEGVFQ
ncbi:hypothetical protein F1640_18580 [Novosphingobium sp. NBM11]|uniref:hypothetical protein n=1 Tax=Novosphingobium sp. NBM11 TaxID=2596914 RepID=UPI00189231E1|nr:hypothetical protein [Novosphingobium sp. NBM11]MBF5091962.1 hypothetical protein [Novosphingobium sp. NBM11]